MYFQRLEQIEKKSGAGGVWSLGNLTNAALGQGDIDKSVEYLSLLRESDEAQSYSQSIARYFDDIIKASPGLEFDWRSVWPDSG